MVIDCSTTSSTNPSAAAIAATAAATAAAAAAATAAAATAATAAAATAAATVLVVFSSSFPLSHPMTPKRSCRHKISRPRCISLNYSSLYLAFGHRPQTRRLGNGRVAIRQSMLLLAHFARYGGTELVAVFP
jgi:hypothetical protein